MFASERPPYPYFLGGAARAAHSLLASLVDAQNVDCLALGSASYRGGSWVIPRAKDFASLNIHSVDEKRAAINCGYPVRLLRDFYNDLATEIQSSKPDILWAQLEGSLTLLRQADELGVTGLCYIHDAEFDFAEIRAIAGLKCHLIASSDYLAEKVYAATGRRPGVIYPPTEFHFDACGDHDGLVTMVNPHPVKGLDVFLDIARRLPDTQFLLQESWKLGEDSLIALLDRLKSLPNVSFAHRVANMRTVYEQTRILLIPSQWEEGFGMVALEAQSCGIPVIASRRGGLTESVGSGGLLIDDYLNVNTWVESLQAVLDDPNRYTTLSRQARENARRDTFSLKRSSERLYKILQNEPEHLGFVSQMAHFFKSRSRELPGVRHLVRQIGTR
ncbi:MAG: glycosyltransferase family 4 protein [Pseudomonadota bacterium]